MKKILTCLLVAFATLILSGCIDSKKLMAELNSEIAKVNACSSVDMTMETKISVEDQVTVITYSIAAKEDNGNLTASMIMSDGQNTDKTYIYKNHVWMQSGIYTEILEITNDEEEEYVEAPITYYFEDFDYKISKKSTEKNTQYIMKFKDIDVEELTGMSLGGIFTSADLTMTFNVDNENDIISSISYSSNITVEDITIKLTVSSVINALGDDVVVSIPANVKADIDAYIIENTPEPTDYVNDYINNDDPAATFYSLSNLKDVLYDASTNKYIVLRNDRVDIYSASMQLEKTYNPYTPACIDVDNGKLVVGYGSTRKLYVYDLNNYSLSTEVNTNIEVFDIAIDGDAVFFVDYDQWCELYHYSISEDIQTRIDGSVYYPALSINREDHILYLAERNSSNSNLLYFDTITLDKLFETDFGLYEYNSYPPYFNNKYLHFYGLSFDRVTGNKIANNTMTISGVSIDSFIPKASLYETNSIAVILGKNVKDEVVFYDLSTKEVLYRFIFKASSATYLGNNKYLLTDTTYKYIAIVDLSQIN